MSRDPALRTRLVAFLAVALLLGAVVGVAVVRSAGELPLRSRVVAGAGAGAWTLLVACIVAALRLAFHAGRPASWPARILRVLCEVALLAGLFLAAISWLLFWRTGAFASFEMLQFLLADPRAVLTLLTREERGALAGAALLALVLDAVIWRALRPGAGSTPDDPAVVRVLSRALGASVAGTVLCLAAYPALALRAEEAGAFVKVACYRTTPGLAMLCSSSSGSGADGAPDEPLTLRPMLRDEQIHAAPDAHLVNVVLVVVESWRRDSLALLGASGPYMPWLDGRSRDALVFSRAYAQSNSTDYAVPSLLSSLYPLKRPTPARFSRLDFPRTLVYDVLAPLGYCSAIFSSGNDAWVDTDQFLDSPSLEVFFHAGKYDDGLVSPQDTGVWRNIESGFLKKGSVDDAVTTAKALSWIGSLPASSPFFLYVNLQTTHFPYQQAKAMATPFAPSALDFDCSFVSYPRDKVEVMRNRYRNSLRYVDDRLRELVESVEAMRLDRETVFVILGDHGEEFFEHGGVTHAQEMNEETLRVPLLVLGGAPFLPRGVDDRPVQQIDVLPTLLGLMRLPLPAAWQGDDVLSPGHDPRDHKLFLTTQNMRNQNVLVWRGFKYVMDRSGSDRLYDLERDPQESRNLLTLRPDVAREHGDVLRAWISAQLTFYGSREYYLRYHAPRY